MILELLKSTLEQLEKDQTTKAKTTLEAAYEKFKLINSKISSVHPEKEVLNALESLFKTYIDKLSKEIIHDIKECIELYNGYLKENTELKKIFEPKPNKKTKTWKITPGIPKFQTSYWQSSHNDDPLTPIAEQAEPPSPLITKFKPSIPM